VLTGRYPSGQVRGAEDLIVPPALPTVAAPVAVLSGRPDLIAAEARVDAAGLRATDARHAMFPQLTLRFDATTRSGSFGDLFDPGTYIDAISAGLLQPLFRGGALLAEAERQGELARSALFTYAEQVLAAFQEVEDRLDAEATLERQVTATAMAAEEARAAVGLTRSRYINGRSTIFDLINAQTTAIAAETRAIEARRARIENRVNLHLALGDEPLPAEAAQQVAVR
jgi:outer membrane protein TolC